MKGRQPAEKAARLLPCPASTSSLSVRVLVKWEFMYSSRLWPSKAIRRFAGSLAIAIGIHSLFPTAAGGDSSELLLQDHGLAGSLWDARSGQQIAEAELIAAALAADWILLGEKHDNPAHHQLQARIVAAIGAAGRRPAVVWEMAGPDQAEAFASAKIAEVSALGQALGWEERGWPAWSRSEPAFWSTPGSPSRSAVLQLGCEDAAPGRTGAPAPPNALSW